MYDHCYYVWVVRIIYNFSKLKIKKTSMFKTISDTIDDFEASHNQYICLLDNDQPSHIVSLSYSSNQPSSSKDKHKVYLFLCY